MPRPPDIGWQYGTMIGGHRHHVKCNYCQRIMIGGITRFKKHLASKKGEIRGCDAVPKEVKEIIKKHLANAKPRKPNRKKRNASANEETEGTFEVPLSTDFNMESDASDPEATKAGQEILTFNEAEIHSSKPTEQQFDVGAAEYFDDFPNTQGKDEQDAALSRTADLGWAHGMMVNGDRQKIQCRYCHKVIFGGGITRLKQHLAGERGNIAPCDKVPDDVKVQMQQHLGFKNIGRLKRKKNAEVENCSTQQEIEDFNGHVSYTVYPIDGSHKRVGNDIAEGNSNKHRKSEKLCISQVSPIPQLAYHGSQDFADQADIMIAKFIYEAGIPFSAANSLYFQRMADAISAAGHGYKVPSYHYLRSKLLDRCTNEAGEFSKELRKSWEVTGCTIMVDRWIDKAGRTVLNFFVYCPKGTMFLKSVDATNIEASMGALVNLFDSVVQDIGPNNIVQILADSHPWYKEAGKQLTNKYGTFFWSVCLNQCIELILKGLSEIDEVNEVMTKAKKICQFIYNDRWALNFLKKVTEGRDMIQLATTQSVMDFLTLQNIVSLKDCLQQMFTSAAWEHSELSKQEPWIGVKEIVLDLQFWLLCERVTKVSYPLISVLYVADSTERPSMGFIYDAIEKAKKDIIAGFDNDESEYMPYLDVVNHVQAELHCPLHAAAYYLNPSIFYSPRFSISKVIQKSLLDCIETLEPDATAQDNITKHKSFYEDAVGDFSRPMALRGRESLAPATWWSLYASDYPDLQRFAIRILNQTCCMTGFERTCNAIEHVHSAENNLESERLQDYAFVHYNLRLQQRQSMATGNKVDPISNENYNAGDWVKDPRLMVQEGANMSDITLRHILAIDKVDDVGGVTLINENGDTNY